VAALCVVRFCGNRRGSSEYGSASEQYKLLHISIPMFGPANSTRTVAKEAQQWSCLFSLYLKQQAGDYSVAAFITPQVFNFPKRTSAYPPSGE
jgi:hypothetical protein